MIDLIVKSAAVAMIAVAAAAIIKKANPESALLLSVITAAAILGASLIMLTDIKELFDDILRSTGISAIVFSPLVKCTAIAVTVKAVGSLCRDSGQGGIASSVEFLGAAASVYTTLPLIRALLKTIGDLL